MLGSIIIVTSDKKKKTALFLGADRFSMLRLSNTESYRKINIWYFMKLLYPSKNEDND